MSFPSTLRSAVAAATVLVGAVVLAGCSGGDTAGDSAAGCEEGKIKIGVLLPLSGPAAAFGQGIEQAIDFAAAEANDDGGITVGGATCTIELSRYDTKGSAEQASAGMNQLISEGVKFVFGPSLSQEVSAIQQIAARNDILVIGASYSSTGISPDLPLIFGAATTPSSFAGPMAEWVSEAYPDVQDVTVVVPDTQGGNDTAKVVGKAYDDAGLQATITTFAEATTDFAPFIDGVLRSQPDAIDVASTPPGTAGVIIKQLRQAGFDGPVGRLGGESTDAIVNAVGSPEGLGEFYWFAPVDFESQPVRDYREKFTAEFGSDPLPISAELLPPARMLIAAIEKAGSTDPGAVATALESLPIDDPTMGGGYWGGKDFYGIDHEIVLDFNGGQYKNGTITLTPIQVGAP